MDGNITLRMEVLVQGEISTLVMESKEPPGLLFIGGKSLTSYIAI